MITILTKKLNQLVYIWRQVRNMPAVEISLMHGKAKSNLSYFEQITGDFYDEANKRHDKYRLIKQMVYGVALFHFNPNEKAYFQQVESSARRNYKKAVKNNYQSRRIDFNQHINDIWEIRKSTPVRQGRDMPKDFLANKPEIREFFTSKNHYHDYVYYGVFNEDNKLVAYCACLVAGQLCMIEHIYGHYQYQNFGVVPMLIIDSAAATEENFPQVKFFGYGSFLGASKSMQRFKKKFQFLPHKVTWLLD